MIYRIFSENGDPKITGVRDGTAQCWFDDAFWSENTTIKEFIWPDDRHDLRFLTGIQPDFELNLFGLPMDKMSKRTDLIFMTSLLTGYIVSGRFREILEQFVLPEHRYYNVSFIKKSAKGSDFVEVDDYWYLYFTKDTGEYTVDFVKSRFDLSYHTKYLGCREKDLNVSSYEDYMNIFHSTGRALQAEELVFNSNFNSDLDLWKCRFLSNKTYVSDRFERIVKQNDLTGTRIVSLEREKEMSKLGRKVFCSLTFE